MKISETHHITKDGVLKKNPVKFYHGYATAEREPIIDELIQLLQESAFIRIEDVNFAKSLINERMPDDVLNSHIWQYLSTDKRSGKLFEKISIDPTDIVVFMDIDFLVRARGNDISEFSKNDAFGKGIDKILKLIVDGHKFESVPFIDLRDVRVGEGNHRVEALKRLGYKSVPVQLGQGWQ